MLVDIINEQGRLGYKVTLIVINNDYSDAVLARINSCVRVVLLKRTSGTMNPIPLLKLNWMIWIQKPDAIHLHNNAICRILWTKRPSFLTVHALNIPLTEECSRLKELFAISDAVGKDIENRYPGQYKIKVINNGISFSEVVCKAEYGLRDGKMHIVQVANLIPEKKGQDLLIESVYELKLRGLDQIYVDFIGGGNKPDGLKLLAESLGVGDRIRFLGLKDRRYIFSHIWEYDLMCHPSRYEGFGLTVAEGIAAGLPVVVPDSDGPCEIIKNGEFGYVFRKGDAKSLADILEEIYSHYEEYAERVVSKARAHVEENYSVRHMVEQYLNEYKSAKSK